MFGADPCGGRLAIVEPRGAVQVSPLCPQDDLGRDDVRVRHKWKSVLKRRGTGHDLRYSGASPGKGRKTMFTSIVRLYQTWRRHETVRRELSHLTDRELADIGITRSDIERIASGGSA